MLNSPILHLNSNTEDLSTVSDIHCESAAYSENTEILALLFLLTCCILTDLHTSDRDPKKSGNMSKNPSSPTPQGNTSSFLQAGGKLLLPATMVYLTPHQSLCHGTTGKGWVKLNLKKNPYEGIRVLP